MATNLDRGRLEAIFEAIAERLPGDWLVLGGALVSVWLDARRTTEDVDVVGLGGTLEERYALMRLAGQLGLPPDALNSSADYFLDQIPAWRREIEPWIRGAAGTIWRPTPTLLLLLKCARLSEHDLADCEAVLAHVEREGLALDRARVIKALDALPATLDAALAARRAKLRALLAR